MKEKEIILHTGKGGIIEYLKLIYKEIGLTEEAINYKIEEANRELPNGCYQITKEGIKLL